MIGRENYGGVKMKLKTYGLKKIGIINPKLVHRNLSPVKLVELALEKEEGILSDTGALVISTGKYTGRSPNDRFIVDSDKVHSEISWGEGNKSISREKFNLLYSKVISYLQNKEIYIFDGYSGADSKHRKKFRVITESASQNLFIHQLLIRPTKEELENYGKEDFTVIVVPEFKCSPKEDGVNSEVAIIINFDDKKVIICGTKYSGEIKKAIFYIMNYIMPLEKVLPMHCSANMDLVTGETALFFGLSGTGKTTLSTDQNRLIIGDDEHGWGENGIFNFEGGCYAKCINITEENEPDIYNAIKFGSIVENVVINPITRKLNFFDNSLTENTRVGYPINFISNSKKTGIGKIPKVIIFLTADAYGVLPPISKLSNEQAMYHFITGFTSKLAGTERGITEPKPTFSECFGAPFIPRNPIIYAEMLGKKIEKYKTKVFLVNTGWVGGPYGVGERIKLKYTRAMVNAAINGLLDNVEYEYEKIFNLNIPKICPNVPEELLNPRNMWKNQEEYEIYAKKLAKLFNENFQKKYPNIDKKIVDAGPKIFE